MVRSSVCVFIESDATKEEGLGDRRKGWKKEEGMGWNVR